MKTILNFKWCILSLIAISSLTSCLSSSDNEVTFRDDFVYITSFEGLKYGATTYYNYLTYISSPEITPLSTGQYYLMSYKLVNPVSGAANKAVISDISDVIKFAPVRPDSPQEEGVGVLAIQLKKWNPSNHLGDGWLFSYQAEREAKKMLDARFYYDSENQVDDKGTDISKDNKIIVDIVFTETDEDFKAENTSKIQSLVAKLSNLRYDYIPEYKETSNDISYANVAVKFRYNKVDNTGKASVQYVGSWDVTNSDHIYMTFIED